MANTKQKKKRSNAEKPISLKPYEFDEAVSDLLKVKPESKNGRSEAHKDKQDKEPYEKTATD